MFREKQQKGDVLENLYSLFEVRKRVFNVFESKIFSVKIEGTGFSDNISDDSKLKILTLKQMLQRLPMGLAQVKTSSKS